MKTHRLLLALTVLLIFLIAQKRPAIAQGVAPLVGQNVASSWYPLQPGDTWVYQKDSREGSMAHPSVERWTTEETIISAVTVPDVPATLVTTPIRR